MIDDLRNQRAGEPPSPVSELRKQLPLLVAGFIISFFVVGGGIDTVSVFLNALSDAEGWTRRGLSAGISVGAVGAGLFTPVAGALVDRFGVRVPMTLGVALLAGGFGILSVMNQPWHFVAANVLLGPGFTSAALLPITIAVTICVPDRTALALGIVGVGSSAGALVLAPAVQIVVDAIGWRDTYLLIGAAVVVTPIPFLLFVLPRGPLQRARSREDEAPGRAQLHLLDELRRPGILALCGVMIIPGLVSFGVQVHLVPYLADLGHHTTFAAGALGAVIGVSAIGKLGGGFLGDRLGPVATLRFALLLKALAIVILALAGSRIAVGGFVVAHGLAVGAQVAVVPVIALAILGRDRFATLYGLLQLASVLTIGLAPLIPGVLFDATGSYSLAIVFWLAVMLLAIWVSFRLRIPGSAPNPVASPTAQEPTGSPVPQPVASSEPSSSKASPSL
jgi:predicted MFS family arabinose efflux permease